MMQVNAPSQPLENETFTFGGVTFQRGNAAAKDPLDTLTIQAYNGTHRWVIYWQRPRPDTLASWKVASAYRSYVDVAENDRRR
jgi:hypothetical protein